MFYGQIKIRENVDRRQNLILNRLTFKLETTACQNMILFKYYSPLTDLILGPV